MLTSLCPLIVAEQLAPHTKPDGQQPPPWLAAQENQASWQLPWASATPVADVPAMMVRLLLVTTAVVFDAGHDVVSQLRPTWQHPPMKYALHM